MAKRRRLNVYQRIELVKKRLAILRGFKDGRTLPSLYRQFGRGFVDATIRGAL